MKNKKWLTYTLGILLTLVVLAVVGGAGFRIGMTQNVSFARPAFAHNFDGGRPAMQGDLQNSGAPQPAQGNSQNDNGNQPMPQRDFQNNDRPQPMPQGNFRQQDFDHRGNDRRDGGRSFFSPIFGLIHLLVLGLLAWFGYKLVKKSGWRITREAAAPASAASETVGAEVEKKKESE